MSALRVAYVNHVGSAIGGGERTLATVLERCPPEIEPHAVLFEDGAFADRLRGLGVAVHVVAAPASIMGSARDRFDPSALLAVPGFALRVAKLLRSLQIDIVYSNAMKAHVIGAIAARLAGVPCVIHFHDVIGGLGFRLVRTVAVFGSTRRVACSGVVRSAFGLDRTAVIYGPVIATDYENMPDARSARLELGLAPDIPAVMLIGRINRWKGHDRFIRIARIVAAQRPVQFVIVGSPVFRDADFLPELHSMVSDFRLESVVRFIPWVDDVRIALAAADINVNCSTREPLGRTPAEAAAAGKPSVVFDDSGAAEWMRARGDGRIVPAWDEAAFARAIVDLLAEQNTPERSARIRDSVRQFEASTIAAQTLAVTLAARA